MHTVTHMVTHMVGRKSLQQAGKRTSWSRLRDGMDEGDLLNNGNGLEEGDMDAEDNILRSFVNERFEGKVKENHVIPHRSVFSGHTPQSSGSNSSRPASSTRRQAYQPRGMSRSTPLGGRGMKSGKPWNSTDQHATDVPLADRLPPTIARKRTKRPKVEESDSLNSEIHDALTSLKGDDRAADAKFLKAFTTNNEHVAANSDRTLKVLEQLMGMIASKINATNAG
ncbi:hypothetical protein WJX79_001691 [Trebouxia sp. C0005]